MIGRLDGKFDNLVETKAQPDAQMAADCADKGLFRDGRVVLHFGPGLVGGNWELVRLVCFCC